MDLKEPTEEAVRLICLEEMALSDEETAMRAAWSELRGSPAECCTLLMQMCHRLSARALPAALGAVCDLCCGADLSREEQIALLTAYLEPLKSSVENREVLPYVHKLADRIHQAFEANDTAFLATRYPLLAVLTAAPAIPHQAEIAAAVKPQNLWENFKKTAAEEQSPEALLKLIQNFQRLLLASNEQWQQFEEMAQVFTRILSGMKGQLLGLASVFDWIAGGLAGQQRHKKIYELIGLMPIVKNDKLVSKWTETCLNRFIEDKVSAQEMCQYAAKARESGVSKHLASPLLLKVLEYLLTALELNEKDRKEIEFLIGCTEPSKEEAPRFAECLASYYRRCVDIKWLFQLFDGLNKHFSQLKGAASFKMGETVASAVKLLKQQPKDAILWQKFTVLFDKLLPDDDFAETALGVLEQLAAQEFLDQNSVRDPCFALFSKKLALLEKKLNESQKVRLAKAVAAFIDRASKEKKETEMVANLSQPWVFALLQRAETSDTFARIFISHYKKNRPAMTASISDTALWLSPFVLKSADDDQIKQLRTIAMDIPVKEQSLKAAEWRRSLAGIACRPQADQMASNVIGRLVALSTGPEKVFFEDCQRKYGNRELAVLQSRLEAYQTTGTVPLAEQKKPPEPAKQEAPAPAVKSSKKKPAAPSQLPLLVLPRPAKTKEQAAAKQDELREAISAIEFLESTGLSLRILEGSDFSDSIPAEPAAPRLSDSGTVPERIAAALQSAHHLETAVRLFEEHTVVDFELWAKLWGFIPLKSPFRERAWKAWLASHPLEKVRAEDGKHWYGAIHNCITGSEGEEAIFDSFVRTQLIPLLVKFEGGDVRNICCLAVEIAINYCWNKKPDAAARLQALHDLTVHQAVQSKVKEPGPVGSLDPELQFRYALLLAASPGFSSMGENLLIDFLSPAASLEKRSGEQNAVYFTNYCKWPYVPVNPASQEIFYQWITVSLVMFQGVLSWDDSAALFHTLCRFQFRSEREEPGFNRALDILAKWERLIARMPARPPLSSPVSVGVVEKQIISEIMNGPTNDFMIAMRSIADRLMSEKAEPAVRFANLRALIESFGKFEMKFFMQNKFIQGQVLLWTRLIFHAFQEIDLKERNSAWLVIDGVARFRSFIPPFYFLWDMSSKNSETQGIASSCAEAAAAFTGAIRSIIRLGMAEYNLFQRFIEVIDMLMGMPLVVNGVQNLYSWDAMLLNIAYSLPDICKTKEHAKKAIQSITKLFARANNPDYVKRKEYLKPADEEKVLYLSSGVLSDYLCFLELECMDPKDWDELFAGIPKASVLNMINLLKDCADHTDVTGLVRIIRYSRAFDVNFLTSASDLLLEVARTRIRPFDKNTYPLIQLQQRWHVVLAMSSLLSKWQQPPYLHSKKNPTAVLVAERRELVKAFIGLALPEIVNDDNYKVYSRILVDIMNHSDTAVLQAIVEGFVIPADHPMKEKLEGMRKMIEGGIKQAKKP
jgi:hypothetical protein